ncbi:MAG TPA: tyrosine-type recombinase/integrase [Pirellulales bacterium]
MARPRKQRRQGHGSAWLWKQTGCWYYTLLGTKKRTPLFDDAGERIRGQENRQVAEKALAKARLADARHGESQTIATEDWLVAKVCSEYIQYCERGLAAGSISKNHRDGTVAFLNDLCGFCGALPAGELKKGHVQEWLEAHAGWRSPATHRAVMAIVLAAFNRAEQMFDVPNPLKGFKKAVAQPRLMSFTAEDEQALLLATEERFGNFLFAAIRTGLRPFCELARLKAEDVEQVDRGMMWRVYSSKTKKTRKIPIHDDVAVLTRRLMTEAPAGSGKPLFRNTRGAPWKPMTGVARFLALKHKLGWSHDPIKGRYSCYTCRHTFAHRMLSGFWNKGLGCTIETLAELLGDTPKVAFDHYGKEWGQNYQAPLWAAIGVDPHRAQAQKSKPTRAGTQVSNKPHRSDDQPPKRSADRQRPSRQRKRVAG